MRVSQYFYMTQRTNPSDAELVSHKLMVRAGMIRKIAGGIYTWLPLGLRIVRKIETIVRDEMNHAGAIELAMPALQPAQLWQLSGRWSQYGAELIRLQDRHQRDFCLGPTHEEIITTLAANELKSYRQLPINLYQIQTKFRDEVRPRFGIMRGREFVMKDAYSFHTDAACLEETYQRMHKTYSRIFTRLGLQFRVVEADSGAIGGNHSHEFHVLADSGEDIVAFCPESNFAANIELCALPPPILPIQSPPSDPLTKVQTPGAKECQQVAHFLQVPLETILKSLLLESRTGQKILVLLRGDHTLNPTKLCRVLQLDEVHLASETTIYALFGCSPGYIGPVNLPEGLLLLADQALTNMNNMVCGANEKDVHYQGLSFKRDIPKPIYKDLRFAQEGDNSPDGLGKLVLRRGIEVGHIFQLHTKYSESMQATFQDQDGIQQPFEMGCYGIGITRIVAAAIEQSYHHDHGNAMLPIAIAPFQIYIVPIGYHKNSTIKKTVDELYDQLWAANIEALLDDRHERPGVMFADHELSCIPLRLVCSDKLLANQTIELIQYRAKQEPTKIILPIGDLIDTVKTIIDDSTAEVNL